MYTNYAKKQEYLTDVEKLWGASTPLCTLTKSSHSKTGLKRICSTYAFPSHAFLSTFYEQKLLTENTERKVSKIWLRPSNPLEQISKLIVNVTTMQSGWWRNQPIKCTASSPPLTKIGGHKDSAAALNATLLQMPLQLLRNLEGGLQISPKALSTTINIGSSYQSPLPSLRLILNSLIILKCDTSCPYRAWAVPTWYQLYYIILESLRNISMCI